MTNRRIEIAHPPDATWQLLRDALDAIGTVEQEAQSTGYLVGKARYGANPVRLRISVLSASPDRSAVEIQARGQDLWGVASRKVIDRLIAACQNA